MDKLSKYLSKHHITQEEFAREIGVKQTTISRYIAGKRRLINPEIADKIIAATHGFMTANDIYGIGGDNA